VLEISHWINIAFWLAASAAALPDSLMSLKTTLAPFLIKSPTIPKANSEAAPITIATLSPPHRNPLLLFELGISILALIAKT
jgi:hypothetical protein